MALVLFGFLYLNVYLGLSSRWWFEDDPFLFDYAARESNPLAAFIDPAVLRGFTVGKALVPMQILSYWVDVRVAGFAPALAYAHQTVSFVLTLLLLYLVLVPFLRTDRLAAFLTCVAWALLPATAVVLQFLATRHYLEGLLFLLTSAYVLQRCRPHEGQMHWAARAGALLAALVSLLYKEVYLPVAAAILFAEAWRHRDRLLGISTGVLLAFYGVYRIVMVGSGLDYTIPLLDTTQYLKFLTKLPYTISSNYGGYCIFAIIVFLGARFVRRQHNNYKTILWFVGALALSLAVVGPVSFPLYGTIRRPDPWYRIVFALNAGLICFGAWLAVRCTRKRTQLFLALVTFGMLVLGVEKTRRLWGPMTASAEREGKFYLSNPDKVLLSEQEAWWFIPTAVQD